MNTSYGKSQFTTFLKVERGSILNFIQKEHNTTFISFMNNNDDRKNRKLHGHAHILVHTLEVDYYYYITKSIWKDNQEMKYASIREDLLKDSNISQVRFLVVDKDCLYTFPSKYAKSFMYKKENTTYNQKMQGCVLVPLVAKYKKEKNNKYVGPYKLEMWKPECIGHTKYNSKRCMGLYKLTVKIDGQVKWEATDTSVKALVEKILPTLQVSGIKCSAPTLKKHAQKQTPFIFEKDGREASIEIYSLSSNEPLL